MIKSLVTFVGLLALTPAYAEQPAAAPTEPAAAPAMAEPAPAEPAAAPAAATEGEVARAQFTTAIQDREPVDQLSALPSNSENIYFFTELKGLEGQTVTHRWEHNGEVMAEVKFDVGGPRWRVYSSKRLDPSWLGEWKVSVIDANGGTLSANTFSVNPAPAESAEPAPAAAPAAPAPALPTAPQQ
jgi:hypothetical protein